MQDVHSALEQQPQTNRDSNAGGAVCRNCQAALPAGTEACPACGRKQTRTCFCGATVPVEVEVCPACGADWSEQTKVVRRRSHSSRLRPRHLLGSALIGALLTVVVSAIVNLIITAMAQRSLPPGAIAASFGERLYYAGCTIVQALDLLFSRLLGGAGVVLLTAFAGAVGGAVFYLIRAGYWRSHTHHSHNGHVVRRRRGSH